jgi:hypothetical protein
MSKTADEATGHFGWLAHFAAIDNPTSSERTREVVGWQSKQPGLIHDIDQLSYFATRTKPVTLKSVSAFEK